MIVDLEEWFTVNRKWADFVGCTIVVVNGQLVMVDDSAVRRAEFTHEVKL